MWSGIKFSAIDISSSGLAAERFRMEVIANNVANANTTQGADGQPFRRQEVIVGANENPSHGGVRVLGVQSDKSELPKIFNPSHPHADSKGYVQMPNVAVSNEMVDLMVASRAYEANLNAIKTFEQSSNSVLELLR